MTAWRNAGVLAALAAALLFGASTPISKVLLEGTSPWLLAGLLYLGSGAGLFLLRRVMRLPRVSIARSEVIWLAGAIAAGGMAAPVLLLYGLLHMPSSGASMLLNAESVFTAAIAWVVFRENFDRRILLGMLCIVAGAVVLSWPGDARFGAVWPALAILGACFAWGLDNNFTRRVSLSDATFIAMAKGLAAGSVNALLALLVEPTLPPALTLAASLLVGFVSYGLSLTLFVIALRHVGTARTGAYFSIAPFVGAAVGIVFLREALTWQFVAAAVLMAVGVWLHLTEHHEHTHTHEPLEHTHEHVHDAHHRHPHGANVPDGGRHSHRHRHEPLTHSHAHYPDAHHRHPH
jgi:drug/metabolite transporter (DMT)-like permease